MTNGFINSKRVYCDKTRYLTNIMFNRRLINGEIIVRSWLVYPLSLGVVFCEPCRIFQTSLETQLVTEGFNNWKNAISCFSYHENSKEYRDAIINLKHRERFNISNKQLQCVEIGNDKVSQIYTSLINLVQKTRDNFNEYETKA
ncbi:hypothetical protein QTP88_029051 [Uroleucon formosanum]